MDAAERFSRIFDCSTPNGFSPKRITIVVLAYNEGLRLPYFLEHHRRLGVDQFIIVDNASTDNTAALLDGQTDVLRLYTERPYKDFKGVWRETIGDALLAGCWALFLDVDELLVYPGWPQQPLTWFCDYLDAAGYDALFTTMVDMYSDCPLVDSTYLPEQSFLEVAPFFDGRGYRLIPLEPHAQKEWPTPPYRVFGGARERIFEQEGKARPKTKLDDLLLQLLFPLSRNTAPGRRRRALDRRALKYLDGSFPKLSPANMSKVPLIRWKFGTRVPGGVHRWSSAYHLAPDWGALLHFKYFDDFSGKVEEAVARGQHAADAAHYKVYDEKLNSVQAQPLVYSDTRQFEGIKPLVDVGLIRISPELRKRIRECVTYTI